MAPLVGLAAGPLLGMASKIATDPVGTAKRVLQLSLVVGGPTFVLFAMKGRRIAQQIEEGEDRTFDASEFEFGVAKAAEAAASGGGSSPSTSKGGVPAANASKAEVIAYYKREMTAAGLPPVLAVMTWAVETEYRNGAAVRGVDHDSAGPFQVRADLHNWTIAQCEDYGYSLKNWFIKNALRYRGQFQATKEGYGAWCQAVQGSAYGYKYAQRYDEAMRLLG